MTETEASIKEENSNLFRDFLTPSLASEKSESVHLPTTISENECALYTTFPHRFISSSNIKGTVFETFTNSSDLIDVSFHFYQNILSEIKNNIFVKN